MNEEELKRIALNSILDDSLDAEDMERLKRAMQHAREVVKHVEQSPTTGPHKRDFDDNESLLAWALLYLDDAYGGLKGIASALAANQAVSTDARKEGLAAWVMENAPDCGDNSCLFGGRGKGGMRTNGGCRCFKDLPTAKRIYVERLYALKAEPPKGVMEWIAVGERLPEGDGKVVELTNGQIPSIADAWFVRKYANEQGGSYALRITHWMPLPEPPNARAAEVQTVREGNISEERRALLEQAVEAQRNDTRTSAERIRDGVSFIMGDGKDGTEAAPKAAPLTREQVERLEEHWYDGGRLSERQIAQLLHMARSLATAQEVDHPLSPGG